jgi:hypothetical protein
MQWAGCSEAGMHQVLHNFVLAVDINGLTASEFGKRDMVSFTSETQLDAVVAQTFPVQPITDAHLCHQIRSELFEDSGANAVNHIILIAVLQDH